MDMRTRLLAGVLGSALFAGAAFAAGDVSLVTAAKQGDRVAVQTWLNGHAKDAVAGAEGTAALVWAATRNDLAMADLLLRAGAERRPPMNSARPRFTLLRSRRIRRWR